MTQATTKKRAAQEGLRVLDLTCLVPGALQLFGKAGEGPIVPGLSIADAGGGSLTATTGILAALISRCLTHEGQFVDISMTDGVVSWLELHAADYPFGGVEPKGGERPFIGQAPCYNVYRCSDGKHVALGAIEPHFWERFCEVAQLPAFAREHYPEGAAAKRCYAEIAAIMATRTRDEWAAIADSADIPLTPANTMQEGFAHPHLQHRQMLMSVDRPVEGTIPQIGFPIKMSGTPCEIRMPPPTLGQHNEEIFGAAGYAPDDIARMRQEGAI